MYELKQMARKMLWKSKKQRLESEKMQNHRQNPPKLPKKSPEQTTHHKKHTKYRKRKKPQEVKKSKQNTGKRKSEGKRLSNRPSKHSVGAKRTFKNVKHLLSPSTNATRALFCPFWSIMKDKFFKNRLKNRRRRSSEAKTSQKGEGLSEILPQMQTFRFLKLRAQYARVMAIYDRIESDRQWLKKQRQFSATNRLFHMKHF